MAREEFVFAQPPLPAVAVPPKQRMAPAPEAKIDDVVAPVPENIRTADCKIRTVELGFQIVSRC